MAEKRWGKVQSRDPGGNMVHVVYEPRHPGAAACGRWLVTVADRVEELPQRGPVPWALCAKCVAARPGARDDFVREVGEEFRRPLPPGVLARYEGGTGVEEIEKAMAELRRVVLGAPPPPPPPGDDMRLTGDIATDRAILEGDGARGVLERIGSRISAWISVALHGVEAEGEVIDPPLGEPVAGFVKGCEEILAEIENALDGPDPVQCPDCHGAGCDACCNGMVAAPATDRGAVLRHVRQCLEDDGRVHWCCREKIRVALGGQPREEDDRG